MATTTISVRMDTDIKRQLDEFCHDVGMSTSTAINLFAHTVVRQQRLPFEINSGEITREELLDRIADLRAGKNTVVKTMEELEALAQ
jgi:DNA-damage-inducible protein J